MSNRKSLTELKESILSDIKCQENSMESFKGDENPQIKEMYNNAKIRLEAMQDVLQYIETGSKFQFQKEEN